MVLLTRTLLTIYERGKNTNSHSRPQQNRGSHKSAKTYKARGVPDKVMN